MDIIHMLSEDEQNYTHLTSQGKTKKAKQTHTSFNSSESKLWPYWKIEKPETDTDSPLWFSLWLPQTVRATGLRGRWEQWWRMWCSSLRCCCRHCTAEHSWETMKTCSTSWQIRSGRWEREATAWFISTGSELVIAMHAQWKNYKFKFILRSQSKSCFQLFLSTTLWRSVLVY